MGTKKVDGKLAEVQEKLDQALVDLQRRSEYIEDARRVLIDIDGVSVGFPLIGAAKAMREERDSLRVQLAESKRQVASDRHVRSVLKAEDDESTIEAARRVVEELADLRKCECEEPQVSEPNVLDDLSEAIGLALGMRAYSEEESDGIVARLNRVRAEVRKMEEDIAYDLERRS